MDDARKGEIAFLVLKHILSGKGVVRIGPDERVNVSAVVKTVAGIPYDEAKEFIDELVIEVAISIRTEATDRKRSEHAAAIKALTPKGDER